MNRTKSINLVADIIAPLAVIAVTIGLFFIFEPAQPGTLFWTNMLFSAYLEIILFAYIIWLPKCGSSVALKWMCGVYSVYYIVISLIWMLLYGVLLRFLCPIKLYIAIIAILTVLWILVCALSFKVDNANETSVTDLSDHRRMADEIHNTAEMLLQQFRLLVISRPELDAASSAVTSLCRGLTTLSPTVMADSSSVMQIRSICSGLKDMMNQHSGDVSAVNLKGYAEKSQISLDYIKKAIIK